MILMYKNILPMGNSFMLYKQNMKNRSEEEIKDLLLEAIEARQIYSIRKLRKQLKEVQSKRGDNKNAK